MNNSIKRDYFFDFLKAFAIFLVLNDHFVGSYADQYYRIFPFSKLIDIFYGKFGVSLFAIISGYFAFLSGQKNKNTIDYLLRRYLFFFCSCLVTNAFYYALNMNGLRDQSSIGMVIGDALLLGDYYCMSFWFIRDFLIGCVFSFILGKYQMKIQECFIISVICFSFQFTFIASAIMGSVLYHVLGEKKELISNHFYKAFLFVILISAAFYRFEGQTLRYTFNTIRAFSFIVFIYGNKYINDISKNGFFSLIGDKTMSILTAHLPVTVLFIDLVPKVSIMILYILWINASILLSLPVNFAIRKLYGLLLDTFAKLSILFQKKLVATSGR